MRRYAVGGRARRPARRRDDAVRIRERARAGDRRGLASGHRRHDRGRQHDLRRAASRDKRRCRSPTSSASISSSPDADSRASRPVTPRVHVFRFFVAAAKPTPQGCAPPSGGPARSPIPARERRCPARRSRLEGAIPVRDAKQGYPCIPRRPPHGRFAFLRARIAGIPAYGGQSLKPAASRPPPEGVEASTLRSECVACGAKPTPSGCAPPSGGDPRQESTRWIPARELRRRTAALSRDRRRCGSRSAPRSPARPSRATRSRGATSRSSRSTCPGTTSRSGQPCSGV